MTKHVFTTDMVAHVWAQRTQDEGRSGNGNLSFQGDVLYSYRTPIAAFVQKANGLPALLVTTVKYSVTTSAHVSAIGGRGVSQCQRFDVKHIGTTGGQAPSVPWGTSYHDANLAEYVAQYATAKA